MPIIIMNCLLVLYPTVHFHSLLFVKMCLLFLVVVKKLKLKKSPRSPTVTKSSQSATAAVALKSQGMQALNQCDD